MPRTARHAAPALFKLSLSLALLCCALCVVATAQQEGASSAAASRTRYLSEAGQLPSSSEVAVEEFVNYHRHQFGRPRAGEAVLMDARWGSDVVGVGQDAVLQVGFSTALANDRRQLRPVNLALVIDKSGSMAAADKMSRVKAALLTLVDQLRETDTLSVVVFDSEAQVLMPARPLGDREAVRRLIRGIEPGSSTNIHAGLMLGYREALKNYRREATNRVVLLTDGIANEGVTDPRQIAQDSLAYNDRGVDLSTIGVGLELNKDLLRELARGGRGLFHFVADAGDIEKVFVKEVQSLVSPVAREPNLQIEYGPGLELVKLYGYEPQTREGSVSLRLDNMNQGLTEVVLLKFRVKPESRGARLPVRLRFNYYDIEQGKQVVKTEESYVGVREGAAGDALRDSEVSKNYTIAQLAQAIRDMAEAAESRRFQDAERLLTAAVAQTYQRYPNLEDDDITRTLLIAQKYQEVLRKYNQQSGAKADLGLRR